MWTSRVGTGYNGKEKDNDWNNRNAVAGQSGEGNSYDYGFRMYNPRLGRFLSEDPLAPEYPWYTPYQYAGNMPIRYIDRDGLELGIPTFDPIAWFSQQSSSIAVTAEEGLKTLVTQTYYMEGQVTLTIPLLSFDQPFLSRTLSVGLGVSFSLSDAKKLGLYPGVAMGDSTARMRSISPSAAFGVVGGEGYHSTRDIAGPMTGAGGEIGGIGVDYQWSKNGNGELVTITGLTVDPLALAEVLAIKKIGGSANMRTGYSLHNWSRRGKFTNPGRRSV